MSDVENEYTPPKWKVEIIHSANIPDDAPYWDQAIGILKGALMALDAVEMDSNDIGMKAAAMGKLSEALGELKYLEPRKVSPWPL